MEVMRKSEDCAKSVMKKYTSWFCALCCTRHKLWPADWMCIEDTVCAVQWPLCDLFYDLCVTYFMISVWPILWPMYELFYDLCVTYFMTSVWPISLSLCDLFYNLCVTYFMISVWPILWPLCDLIVCMQVMTSVRPGIYEYQAERWVCFMSLSVVCYLALYQRCYDHQISTAATVVGYHWSNTAM